MPRSGYETNDDVSCSFAYIGKTEQVKRTDHAIFGLIKKSTLSSCSETVSKVAS